MKKLLPLALLPLTFAVNANNLVIDDTGAEFKSGVTIGSEAVEKAGTIRFSEGEFEGFDGEKWVSLVSGSDSDTDQDEQRVFDMEKLSDEEVQEIMSWVADWCGGSSCTEMSLYNSDTKQTYQTNLPTDLNNGPAFSIMNKEQCTDLMMVDKSGYRKYVGTDFNFYVAQYSYEYYGYDGSYEWDMNIFAEHQESGACFRHNALDSIHESTLSDEAWENPAVYFEEVTNHIESHIRALDALRIQ